MKKILAIFPLVAAFVGSALFSAECSQNYWLPKKLEYKAAELLQGVDYLYQETSRLLPTPDWDEKRVLDKLRDLRENSEELYKLSRDYYTNESLIFALLGQLSWQIKDIMDRIKYHPSLRMLEKDCFSCSELIDEYKRTILEALLSQLEEQASDFYAEMEAWVDKEIKRQVNLWQKALQFEQNCQKIHRELKAYHFELEGIKDLISQLYNFSLEINADLKREETSKSLERKWGICLSLVENIKNTIELLCSHSTGGKESEKKENNLPVGFLDVASRDEISGWAFDIDSGIKPITVHIYINNRHMATVLADQKREDLLEKVPGLREPYHGFRWKPKNLPPGRLLLKVYAINVPPGENPLLGQKIIY